MVLSSQLLEAVSESDLKEAESIKDPVLKKSVLEKMKELEDEFSIFTCMNDSKCKHIVYDPLQCQKCFKLVCRVCQDKLVQVSGDPKASIHMCEKDEGKELFKRPSKFIIDRMPMMQFRCKNHDKGCRLPGDSQYFNYVQIFKHMQVCEYELYLCPYN